MDGTRSLERNHQKVFFFIFYIFCLVLKKYLPPRVSLSNPLQNIPKYFYAKETLMWMWHIIKNLPHLPWDAIDIYRQRHIHIRFRNPLTVLLKCLWWQKGWGWGLHVLPRWTWLCFALLVYLFYIRASLWQGTVKSPTRHKEFLSHIPKYVILNGIY